MPDAHRRGAEELERERRVPVVVRAGERDDRDPRPVAHGAASELDRERLDQRIREQVARHALERGLRLGGIGVVELDVDEPADARAGDGEPERAERVTDRLALRVENAFLGTDQHGRLHRTTFGSER